MTVRDSVEIQPQWVCGFCGTPVGSEVALGDHQEWCLGDARLNERLIADVVASEGELTQESLVAAAEHFRLAQEGANSHGWCVGRSVGNTKQATDDEAG